MPGRGVSGPQGVCFKNYTSESEVQYGIATMSHQTCCITQNPICHFSPTQIHLEENTDFQEVKPY